MTPQRVWLVTGSSTGVGRRMVEVALEKGDKVVATLRNTAALQTLQTSYGPDRLLVVKLDVTDTQQIQNAFVEAKRVFGRVDVVFNNAGTAIVGEIEGTPDVIARKLFDVDFWGAVNVAKEAVRFFREENEPGVGGRLLIVSSGSALMPAPTLGFYSAAKTALEVIGQILAQEVYPEWNIKITLIEFGFIRTQMRENADIVPAHPAYNNPSDVTSAARQWVLGQFDPSNDSQTLDMNKVTGRIYDVSMVAQPPLRLTLSQDMIKRAFDQAGLVKRDLEEYRSWSDNLLNS